MKRRTLPIVVLRAGLALCAALSLAPMRAQAQAQAVAEPAAATPTAGPAAATKLKFTGYVQGRFEWHADAHDGLDEGGKVLSTTQFLVRRARLKADATSSHGQAVLQIDATGKGVVLKDAEASLTHAAGPARLKLTVGQFKWPFGYEMVQSSGERELPDRTRMWKAVFPSERDRGVRLVVQHPALSVLVALVNGNGIEDTLYLNNDPNAFKDVVGRIQSEFSASWGTVAGGVSGYRGRSLRTKAAVAAKVSGKDTDGDGKVTGAELSQTAAVPATNERFDILRLGADLQLTLNVPHVGRLALKGEGLFVRDTHAASGDGAADPGKDADMMGWSLLAVQHLPHAFGVVVRVDGWDPHTNKEADATTTVGAGLLWAPVPQAKLVAVYERPFAHGATGPAGTSDAFALQLQGGF